MQNLVIGILAHVDAGKTTLAEALLYQSGALRKQGRVDRGDTAMDTHEIERARGITIFASEAHFAVGDYDVTLLDTPGHVDFSAETERTLQVLDYAILVISGTDGVQAHTRTLWKLLRLYHVPTLIFVTKMDFARKAKGELLDNLRGELDDNCIDFTDEGRFEQLAMCREDLLEQFLDSGTVADAAAAELIAGELCYPVWFGSGLKGDGVAEFCGDLARYLKAKEYPREFGARVFKISHDGQGNRLTHLKVTGGTLRVRAAIGEEKINQIRLYQGAKFTPTDEVSAGGVCAVTGLSHTENGQGLGFEDSAVSPVLEPMMNYRIVLPEVVDSRTMLPKLRLLEEEDPQLHIFYDSRLQEIRVSLMGKVQAEILQSVIAQRFGVDVDIDRGRVMYKETICGKAEGVGHYEPLKHYAEVHLILEPLPTGSGLVFASACSEDILDRNWQRLILMHVAEKQHSGVLTGSPITDIRFVLAAGRAHLKHTEGGDFRQCRALGVLLGLGT